MTTKTKPKRTKKNEVEHTEQVQDSDPKSLIEKFIEKPSCFLKTDVHNLWEDYYRVNVWTQRFYGLVPTNRVSLSYFLRVTDRVEDLTR